MVRESGIRKWVGKDGEVIEKGCGGPVRWSLGANDCGPGAEGSGKAGG